jgi:hypothetical protein
MHSPPKCTARLQVLLAKSKEVPGYSCFDSAAHTLIVDDYFPASSEIYKYVVMRLYRVNTEWLVKIPEFGDLVIRSANYILIRYLADSERISGTEKCI